MTIVSQKLNCGVSTDLVCKNVNLLTFIASKLFCADIKNCVYFSIINLLILLQTYRLQNALKDKLN